MAGIHYKQIERRQKRGNRNERGSGVVSGTYSPIATCRV